MTPTANSTRYALEVTEDAGVNEGYWLCDGSEIVGWVSQFNDVNNGWYWELYAHTSKLGSKSTAQAAMDALVKAYEQTLEAQS